MQWRVAQEEAEQSPTNQKVGGSIPDMLLGKILNPKWLLMIGMCVYLCE